MRDIRVIFLVLALLVMPVFFSGCGENERNITENKAPQAFISVNRSHGELPLSISFNGSGEDSDGTIVSYHWDFGDGNSATGETTTHTYTNNGTYTVTLTVKDDDGATGTDSISISVDEETELITLRDLALQSADLIGNYELESETYPLTSENNTISGFEIVEGYKASFEDENGGYLAEILFKYNIRALCTISFEQYVDYLKTNISNQSLNLETIGDDSYFTMNTTSIDVIELPIYYYAFRIDKIWVFLSGFDMFDTNYNETLYNYCKEIESNILAQPWYQIDTVGSEQELVTASVKNLNLKLENLPEGFIQTLEDYNDTYNETLNYFEEYSISYLEKNNQENITNLTSGVIKFISADDAKFMYDLSKMVYGTNQTFTHIENFDDIITNESVLYDIDCDNLSENNENYTYGKFLVARNRNILLLCSSGSKNPIDDNTIIAYANIVVDNINKSLN